MNYEVQVFQNGRLRSVIRRAAARQPTSRDQILEHVGPTFEARTGRRSCAVPGPEAVDIKGYLADVPAIDGIAVSPEGQLWVRRGALPASARVIEVFDRAGRPLGSLPPGTPFPVAFTSQGIAASEEDEFGVQRLVLYSIGGADSTSGHARLKR